MKELLRRVLPDSFVHFYQSRGLVAKAGRQIFRAEREAHLLPLLCQRGRAAIDVGAHNGAYTQHMLRHAPRVFVFEPQPLHARRLAAAYRWNPRVKVSATALSDREAQTELRIPMSESGPGTGLATIGALNDLAGAPVQVAACPLDRLGVADVGFIKIDVEGHEHAVLRGAMATLARWRPNLLIESEERHHPDALPLLRRMLEPLGYAGLFLLDWRLRPVAEFDRDLHQSPAAISGGAKQPGRIYINNFIFVADAPGFAVAAEDLLRRAEAGERAGGG